MVITEREKQNFQTLAKAFLNGDVAVMECQLVETLEIVPVICAVNPRRRKFMDAARRSFGGLDE